MTALNEGVDAGFMTNEAKKILIPLYAYVEFPQSLNVINTFMKVMDELRQRVVNNEDGPEATPMPADFNRDQFGAETRAKKEKRSTIPPLSDYQLLPRPFFFKRTFIWRYIL